MAIKDLIETKKCLFFCNGGSCKKKETTDFVQAIRKTIKDMGLDDKYHTVRTMCMGRCDDAPVALLAPDNIWLQNISSEGAPELLDRIESNDVKNSRHFMYQMGDKHIKSNSIPTKFRKNNNYE